MKITKGTVVQFHYKIQDLAGKELESNYNAQAVAYLHGFNNMMPGVEKSLDGLQTGDELEAELDPSETYGAVQDNSQQRVPIKHLSGAKKWKPGMTAVVNTDQGQREVTIVKAGKFVATIDTNHPLAGQTLRFTMKVAEVRAATEEEKSHGHAHGVGGHQH